MDTRRDPTTLYPYSSTWNASGVSQSQSLPLHNPQQYPHPMPRQAIPQDQILDAMMRQEYAHDYSSYGRDQNSPTSYSPRQPMPTVMTNPHLLNHDYHGSSESHRPQATQASYGHVHQPPQYAPQSPIDGSMQYPASPPRPFACDLCALSFNRQHDLKRHRDTHTGDKPFPCESCGKSFTRKDALKRHQVREHAPLPVILHRSRSPRPSRSVAHRNRDDDSFAYSSSVLATPIVSTNLVSHLRCIDSNPGLISKPDLILRAEVFFPLSSHTHTTHKSADLELLLILYHRSAFFNLYHCID